MSRIKRDAFNLLIASHEEQQIHEILINALMKTLRLQINIMHSFTQSIMWLKSWKSRAYRKVFNFESDDSRLKSLIVLNLEFKISLHWYDFA